MPADLSAGTFGLYLHWPFCQAKCPYCDFNSHVAATIDHDIWLDAYLAEIDRVGRETGDKILSSVFFGGGTPSLMPVRLVDAILDRIGRTWRMRNDIEITLEANPTSVEAARFSGLRTAGVNRVSVGLQALSDRDLKALGRLHTADEGQRALATALGAFDRVSFDLIYARQNQTPDAWATELTKALGLGARHLSLYQLTIEDGTAFGARHLAGKLGGLPDEDAQIDMYEITQDLCGAAGLPAYETSNHAVSGQESRHNMIYWTGGDWAGIGPGAHGRLTLDRTRWATETHLAPGAWLEAVRRGDGERQREALSREAWLTEYALMGLRLRDGIDRERFLSLGGHKYINNINGLEESGWVESSEDRIALTAAGRPLLNRIAAELLAD